MGFAAYFLILVISYILLLNPDIEPFWGGILLAFSLIAIIAPGYAAIKALLKILSSSPMLLLLLILLFWLIFYPLARSLIKTKSKEDEFFIFLLSLGIVLFSSVMLEAGVAFAMLILHLHISKRIWRLASRAREKVSGKPLPELFR